jgi:hypothetical protein
MTGMDNQFMRWIAEVWALLTILILICWFVKRLNILIPILCGVSLVGCVLLIELSYTNGSSEARSNALPTTKPL